MRKGRFLFACFIVTAQDTCESREDQVVVAAGESGGCDLTRHTVPGRADFVFSHRLAPQLVLLHLRLICCLRKFYGWRPYGRQHHRLTKHIGPILLLLFITYVLLREATHGEQYMVRGLTLTPLIPQQICRQTPRVLPHWYPFVFQQSGGGRPVTRASHSFFLLCLWTYQSHSEAARARQEI